MIVQIKHKTGKSSPATALVFNGCSRRVLQCPKGGWLETFKHPWSLEMLDAPALGDAKESSMRKARVRLDDSERHKGSGTAESCVPAPGITGQVFHGSCEMTSSGRTFKHHPSSCHFSACGLLSLPPPPPPRLIHKDFLIPIKLSETK